MSMEESPYHKGRLAELEVARYLARHGCKPKLSPGSRGPADVSAKCPWGKTYVQVKSGKARISRKEIKELKKLARRNRGSAWVAHVRNGKIRFLDL
ncbi:MAG: restriction endonuclease [Pyrobaculum sp.]